MSSDFDVKLNLEPMVHTLYELGTKANQAFLSISENISEIAELATEFLFDDSGEVAFTTSTFGALCAANYGCSSLGALLGSAVLLSYNSSMKEDALDDMDVICYESSNDVDIQNEGNDEEVSNLQSSRPSVEADKKQQADLFNLAQVTVVGSIVAKLLIGDSAIKYALALPLASRTFSFFNQN